MASAKRSSSSGTEVLWAFFLLRENPLGLETHLADDGVISVTFCAVDYADDLAIIAESVNDAEFLLEALETSTSLVGLSCNEPRLNTLPPLQMAESSPVSLVLS